MAVVPFPSVAKYGCQHVTEAHATLHHTEYTYNNYDMLEGSSIQNKTIDQNYGRNAS
jgi:hypothetical protein